MDAKAWANSVSGKGYKAAAAKAKEATKAAVEKRDAESHAAAASAHEVASTEAKAAGADPKKHDVAAKDHQGATKYADAEKAARDSATRLSKTGDGSKAAAAEASAKAFGHAADVHEKLGASEGGGPLGKAGHARAANMYRSIGTEHQKMADEYKRDEQGRFAEK